MGGSESEEGGATPPPAFPGLSLSESGTEAGGEEGEAGADEEEAADEEKLRRTLDVLAKQFRAMDARRRRKRQTMLLQRERGALEARLKVRLMAITGRGPRQLSLHSTGERCGAAVPDGGACHGEA